MANAEWTDSEDWEDENAIWCDLCQGLGTAACHCGGDQCYCDNNGEMECPTCNGEGRYVPTAREMQSAAVMRRILAEALESRRSQTKED